MAGPVVYILAVLLANILQLSSAESLPPPLILAFDENEEPLLAEPDSDLILTGTKSVSFACLAPYPVQWSYSGNGEPRMVTVTSTPSQYEHKAEAIIENVDEHQTGAYFCSSTEDPAVRAFYFVYVPGPTLFAPVSGKTIEINSNRILIPCSPSSPDVVMNLNKISGPELVIPPSFDPRAGFIIEVEDQREAQGAYECTAQDNEVIRALQYHAKILPSPDTLTLTLTPEITNDPPCDPPCPDTAKCVFTGQGSESVCRCIAPLVGDGSFCRLPTTAPPTIPPEIPNYPPAPIRTEDAPPAFRPYPPAIIPIIAPAPIRTRDGSTECIGHGHCPEYLSCFADNTCRDPCTETIQGVSCTRTYGSCTVVDHYPRCDCPEGTYADRKEGCIRDPQDEPKDDDDEDNHFTPDTIQHGYNNPETVRHGHHTPETVRQGHIIPEAIQHGYDNPETVRHGHMTPETIRHGLSTPETIQHGYDSPETVRHGHNAPETIRDGPCKAHTDCPYELSCFVDGLCRDPCTDSQIDPKCGLNAVCKTLAHSPICTCPGGYSGNPLEACYASL